MGRATLSQARRVYTFSETLLVSFAQANIPYAVEILLLLQFADLLVARILAHCVTAIPDLADWFADHDARSAFSTAVAKTTALAAGWSRRGTPAAQPRHHIVTHHRECIISDRREYNPPKLWNWDKPHGGKFASITLLIAGAAHDRKLPVGRHPLQLYSLPRPKVRRLPSLSMSCLGARVQVKADGQSASIRGISSKAASSR